MLSFIQEHWAGANNSWAFRDLLRLLWAPRNPVSLFWALRDLLKLPWALRDPISLVWALRDPISLLWTFRDPLRLLWASRDPLDCPELSEISMRSPEPYWAPMSIEDGPAALKAQCGPGIPGRPVLKCWCTVNLMIFLLSLCWSFLFSVILDFLF